VANHIPPLSLEPERITSGVGSRSAYIFGEVFLIRNSGHLLSRVPSPRGPAAWEFPGWLLLRRPLIR